MVKSITQLKRYRSGFGWIFAVSFAVLLTSNLFIFALPVPEPLTHTCRFNTGPKAGTTETYPQVQPIPIGNSCTDGAGSSGTTVADPKPNDLPAPLAAPEPVSLAMLISVASLLTSVTSLAGFFFTTAIAWRKERRDQRHTDLDLEKKRLEVEKLRLEVEGHMPRDAPPDVPSHDDA